MVWCDSTIEPVYARIPRAKKEAKRTARKRCMSVIEKVYTYHFQRESGFS